MSEIAVQFASRYIRRKQSDAVGKNLLKTLTEPITNSDDSYRRIAESEAGHALTVFPITIAVDQTKRVVRIIDQAQGMSADEMEAKFKEYGAAKSGAYEGFSARGIFGQGLSDVLFYHHEGRILSIKSGKAAICSFYWKREKQYIKIDSVKSNVSKLAKDWGINGQHGTAIEFVLDNTVLHDYENLVTKLRVFYMLRLINNNDRRAIKLIYKEKKTIKESLIKYEFPKGDLVDSRKFILQFESYPPVTVDAQLYKSSTALPTVGDERENGLLVYDENKAVYDQTFFGLDDLPGADKFFGSMKLVGARDIILAKINDKKHPEEILSDSRDGFNKQHDFYKQLASAVKDWLSPILNEERHRRTNEGVPEATVEKHRQAFETLNNLYKQLTGEDVSGTIRTKKKVRPAGGMQFARSAISVTFGKRYGLQLIIDTNVIKPGETVVIESTRGLVGYSPVSIEVEEAPENSDGLLTKTIVVTGSKARTVDTLRATADKRSASVIVSIVSEDIVYPEKGIIFSPDYMRTIAEKDSVLSLYVDLTAIRVGSKINLSSTNDSIVLKKSRVTVPGRMRATPRVAKIEIPFYASRNEESGIIEASCGEYLAQCKVDIKVKTKSSPIGNIGKFRDWDFDDSVPKHLQTTFDPMDGSPTQGFILINSTHPINRRYFGDAPEKKEVQKSHKAQLYLAELILNEALGGMVNEAYQKGIIPQNYGPGIDIPVYIAQKKFELGDMIYNLFVEPELKGHEARRVERLEEVKEKSELTEEELLASMKDRARVMVEMYFGLGEQRQHTLEEIAAKSGITRERVRQIINSALASARAEDEEEEEPYDEEADTKDYIVQEEKRLKSEAELIIEKSAQLYGVDRDELREHIRRADIVIPRQVAMYLLRTDIGLSFPSIGKMFDRDHTTVIHACNKVTEMIKRNAKVRGRIERIRKYVESAPGEEQSLIKNLTAPSPIPGSNAI